MRHDLLFDTGRFNLSEEGEHFINPGCFGEDLAGWLRDRLTERGVAAGGVGQEDWGWYLDATLDGRTYLVGVGGNAAETGGDPNFGEWRVMIEKQRSLSEKLLGRARMAPDEPIVGIVRGILEAEADFANVRADDA